MPQRNPEGCSISIFTRSIITRLIVYLIYVSDEGWRLTAVLSDSWVGGPSPSRPPFVLRCKSFVRRRSSRYYYCCSRQPRYCCCCSRCNCGWTSCRCDRWRTWPSATRCWRTASAGGPETPGSAVARHRWRPHSRGWRSSRSTMTPSHCAAVCGKSGRLLQLHARRERGRGTD